MVSYLWNILTAQGGFDFLTLLALAAAKATLLLAFAAMLCFAFRRLSAATRHLLWASALCASLLLPFLSFMKMWDVPILPSRMSVLSVAGAAASRGTGAAFEIPSARVATGLPVAADTGEGVRKVDGFPTNADLPEVSPLSPNAHALEASPQNTTTSIVPRLVNGALAVWLIGMLLVLCKLLAGFVATHMLTRRAVEVEDPALAELFSSLLLEVNLKRSVRLLRSERTSMPIVYGILRPAVLLPAEAEAWTGERRRVVLLHELTHVTRRDCLTQMMAQVACAVYWFNPFVWFAARRLRVEREQACDDYVLSIGTKPSDYANHLLEIARSMQERSVVEWSQTASVAMARRSQLEGRLLAILSEENKRGAVSRAAVTALVALTCVVLLSLAAIRPTVIHARNAHPSAAASNDNEDNAERALPGSMIAAADSMAGDDMQVQVAGAHEPGGKQEDDAHASASPPQLLPEDGNVEREAAPGISGVAERDVEQVVEAVAEQTVTNVQTAEAKAAPADREPTPFIKTEYRQAPAVQTQGRPGDYIEQMAAAGYTNLSVDELIRLKTSGVTPDFVRGLRALGFTGLTAKELVSLSIHGVTPAYIQSVRAAGYNELSAKELTSFRIHGVTPEYIRTLRDAGYGNLDAKQLVNFRIHRVTPAFISEIRALGYSTLTPKDLVSLRVYNITPDFIRRARSRLGELTLKQLISLKNIGILDEDKTKDKDKDKAKS